jgi:ABC-type iron transport system FetAB permease component
MELNGLLCVSYLLRVVFTLNAPASKFLCFIFTVFGFCVLFAPKAQSLKLNLKVSYSLSSMYFGCVLVLFMALVCFVY